MEGAGSRTDATNRRTRPPDAMCLRRGSTDEGQEEVRRETCIKYLDSCKLELRPGTGQASCAVRSFGAVVLVVMRRGSCNHGRGGSDLHHWATSMMARWRAAMYLRQTLCAVEHMFNH